MIKRYYLLFLVLLFFNKVNSKNASITVIGRCIVAIDLYTNYVEFGFSAHDSLGSDITPIVQILSNINTQIRGKYYVKYFVHDSLFQSDTFTRTVLVGFSLYNYSDTSLWNIQVKLPSNFMDQLIDSAAKLYQLKITKTGLVNPNKCGNYLIALSCSDTITGCVMNKFYCNVFVSDTLPPRIFIKEPILHVYRNVGDTVTPWQFIDTVIDNYDSIQQITIKVFSNMPEDSNHFYQVGGSLNFFKYIAIDQFGNVSDTVSKMIISRLDGGLNEMSINRIKVYPNPAHNSLMFQVDENKLNYVQLFSVTGCKIGEPQVLKSNQLDISALPSGLYTLQIISNSFEEHIKFIKE